MVTKKWWKFIAIGAALVVSAVAVINRHQPENYAECVLKNMPKAQSNKAAVAIAGACRQQFPEYVSFQDALTASPN